MLVYRSIEQISAPLRNPVVTVGNFDGVHLGHREIFRKLGHSAREIGGVSVVITFDPHPLKVIPSGKSVTLINTVDEKITLIEASGIDYLLIIKFDATFAAISAADFVERILVDRIGLKRLIVGYDYAFGKGREGNISLLKKLGSKFSFDVEELPPISDGTLNYSSSLIRKMIADGAVAEVIPYLGRNFSIAGRVVHGSSRGKSLGFPTANIVTDKELLPADGVYAVKVKIDEALYDAACNIGLNPTFDTGERSIEIFIFDLDEDLYGKEIRVYFFDRLRSERCFGSVNELVTAIKADVEKCREILASSQLVVYREYLGGA
jgi:riboflavin kinase/FMN adenylyltransferase